jgi:hypothetical protein
MLAILASAVARVRRLRAALSGDVTEAVCAERQALADMATARALELRVSGILCLAMGNGAELRARVAAACELDVLASRALGRA